jgi:hypothetical protein
VVMVEVVVFEFAFSAKSAALTGSAPTPFLADLATALETEFFPDFLPIFAV